jgi:hypothetical protein
VASCRRLSLSAGGAAQSRGRVAPTVGALVGHTLLTHHAQTTGLGLVALAVAAPDAGVAALDGMNRASVGFEDLTTSHLHLAGAGGRYRDG